MLPPANMRTAGDYNSASMAKTSAILGGQTSRLAMIAAQQSGGSTPMAQAPAPLKITEATAQPKASTVTLASTDAEKRPAMAAGGTSSPRSSTTRSATGVVETR